eukprot:1159981-Pelagomonas_calceolata.AAC.5
MIIQTLPKTASAHFTNSESKSYFQRSTGTIYKEMLQRNFQTSIAKYQANLKDNNLFDTGIPNAGPGGKPFFTIAWLAREEARLNLPPLFPI